jgi:hypothetical protein
MDSGPGGKILSSRARLCLRYLHREVRCRLLTQPGAFSEHDLPDQPDPATDRVAIKFDLVEEISPIEFSYHTRMSI